jgi:hypothetical protein
MQKPTYRFDTDGHTVVEGDSAKKKSPVIKDCCPYCKKPMRWNQWKEDWSCDTHGNFDVSEAVRP